MYRFFKTLASGSIASAFSYYKAPNHRHQNQDNFKSCSTNTIMIATSNHTCITPNQGFIFKPEALVMEDALYMYLKLSTCTRYSFIMHQLIQFIHCV